MKTDGIFDYRVVDVPFESYNKPISLYCISDVHRNSPACAVDRWHEFLNQARDDRNQKLFLFLGDMVDALSTSERRFLLAGGFHDSTMQKWEHDYLADVSLLSKECSFAKNKTIGVFSGNHFFKFSDGTTSDQVFAKSLNAPFIGCAGYIILNLIYRHHKHSHAVKIFAHHGLGGGRTAGASFNKLEYASGRFRADIVLMGHDHQRGAKILPVLDCVQTTHGYRIQEKNIVIARTGAFLKSYERGQSSYAVDSLMSPSSIGALKIVITPKRTMCQTDEMREDNRCVEFEVVV